MKWGNEAMHPKSWILLFAVSRTGAWKAANTDSALDDAEHGGLILKSYDSGLYKRIF